jgi:hypothetical protein
MKVTVEDMDLMSFCTKAVSDQFYADSGKGGKYARE